jgi:DNA repair protein RecO (recombination protein O)
MRCTDDAIVLHAIRHGDKRLILKVYTREHGLLTVVCSVSHSRSAKVRAAAVQALSIIQASLVIRQNREIQQLTDASITHVYSSIPFSLPRLCLAQFINEVLIKTLREQHHQPGLYDFVRNCLSFLDDEDSSVTNLHLYFMLGLSRFLGFEPRNNFSLAENFFDCREGAFTPVALAFPLGLGRGDSELFSAFLNSDILSAPYTGPVRQQLLEIMVAYFQLHVPGFSAVESIPVLREVLAG